MSDNSQLFAKLKELNELKEQSLIPTELYEQKSKEVLGKINSNNVYEIENNAQPINAVNILAVVSIFIVVIILACLVINM